METFYRNVLIVFIWISTSFLESCSATKTCQTLHLTNAAFYESAEGYYDLVEYQECGNRVVYRQRSGEGNLTGHWYIYYTYSDELRYGWAVGLEPCSSDYVFMYNWNNNKRPDYTIRYWIEKEDSDWYYSFDLRLTCTEGLKFGELIGVIIASILAVPILAIIIYVIVKKLKTPKRTHIETRTEHTTPAYPPSASRAGNIYTNYAFNNMDSTMYPVFDPSQPFPIMMEPPPYDGDFGGAATSFPENNIVEFESKPPTYEEFLAETARPQEPADVATGQEETGSRVHSENKKL